MKDLIENKELRPKFLTDSKLAVDEFAVKHMDEIRAYYRRAGYEITEDDAHQLACKIWRWTREPAPL